MKYYATGGAIRQQPIEDGSPSTYELPKTLEWLNK